MKSHTDYNFDELVVHYSESSLSKDQKENLRVEAQTILRTLINTLKALSSESKIDMPKDLYFLENKSFPVFLNLLYTDSEWEATETIDELVQTILDALTHYQNSVSDHDKKYLFEVSSLLSQVQCKPSLMQTVKKYAKIFSANYKGYDEENTEPKKMNKFYLFFVIPLFFIVRPALTYLSNQNHRAQNENDAHNAIQHWPKPVKNEAETFVSYRDFMAGQDSEFYLDFSKNWNLFNAKEFSSQSPFLYVTQANQTFTDSSFRKIIVSNKTDLQLILVSLYSTSCDAFLLFPNMPDTVYLKPEAKLCFYFGDSLMRPKDDLIIETDNAFLINQISEIRFANRDPMAKEVFQENFMLELKPDKKSKKEKALPELELTNDFFMTKKIETKRIKLIADVSQSVNR